MLALATGWTPDVIGRLPLPFHVACHWVLYVHAIAPQGLPDLGPAPLGLTDAQRAQRAAAVGERARLSSILYPAD